MRLFSRNKEATESLPASDVPFESMRRSPRNTRKPRESSTAFDAGPPLDPADASRTRARRRLIGAIALALAAIVFVPMLFDRAPIAPSDDIGLQIPDRDTPFEGRRGVPDPAKGPLRPTSDLPVPSTPSAPAAVEATPPTVPEAAVTESAPVRSAEATPSTKAVDNASTPKPAIAVVTKSPTPAPEKAAEKPVEKPVDKPRAASVPPADDPRALAALEGRAEPSVPAGDKGYAVQIAAFSTADRARGLRDQLVANGLKSYVESVSTTQGLRTRVRLGPFTSREAADKARQKLKTMKLDGSVVPL